MKPHQFTGQSEGPHLLITGGVHGDEFEPIAAIRRLIDQFGEAESGMESLNGTVTLVPIVNEPAFWRGHRCADDGLDLARTCPGNADGSVTEQTAWALSQLIRSADYYIDLHTGGTELSVFPLAGYMLHADRDVLDIQRRMARAFNLPIVWGTSGELNGRSLSVARDAEVPAIYCEYLGGGRCSADGVAAYVDGCWNVMRELGMISAAVPEDCVEYLIEDPRPASGHLQVRHPSPVDGFFEASVQLGTQVRQGDVIGAVRDTEQGERHEITSEHTGLVLVLRTFPRVHAGESVGVVLDMTVADGESSPA